jgi:hypothetical protein
MFLDLIEAVQANVTVIERDFPKLLKGNRNMADPFVIGVAQLAVPPLTVVTEERLGQANLERPNIPFVCDAFGAPYCTFIQMLRDTGFRFA